ncbi:T9SS type A sorting domain-containing protein [Maribellus sediminis]|uniref:T9SS type A sorting domain-containing protein n=1 Tax=Maribellus sediminis TaxID=2696285 RepID=UPI00142F625E|nr:T9SS type A sorting domain-containing protein [Maribellus sediminis]
MKNFTFFLLAFFFVLNNLYAQDANNSVGFLGETPNSAIVGGTAILDVNINVADSLPANLMIGIIKLDAEGNPGIQPVTMKIIQLSDTVPYAKQVTDTISVPADLALSSTLTDGDKYAYFCTILTAAFSPIDAEYSEVNVVDISVGNNVGFSPSPYDIAMPGSKIALTADLTIADAQAANLMFGVIKRDAEGNPDVQPQIMKIIPLTGDASYCKHLTDTISLPADFALSSTLTEGTKYSYFCTILTAAFSPVDQEYSDVSVVESTNSVSFSPLPNGAASPGDEVLISAGITVADAQPANLMIGIIKLDADGNPDIQPQIMKIIRLTDEAPYCKRVTDTVSIPADFALSSTLSNGDKYAYFCTILTATFSPVDQEYSEVLITVTSVNEYNLNSVGLYPNPVKDIIHLTDYEPNEQVGVYSVAGALILNSVMSSNEIDVSGLNPGVYLLKGKSFVSKFIKQ